MATHFLADVHLTGDDDASATRLREYCRGPALAADSVYFLGDLFDVWIGDDGSLGQHRRTIEAIGELARSGTAVYFMRGNRDFAVGDEFFAASGAALLDDPWVGVIEGVQTLLSHGDLFCTNDEAQQRFRARYTDPRWRQRMLRVPLTIRRLAARHARWRSSRRAPRIDDSVLDVDPTTLNQLASNANATRVIHGHTHRPADDQLGGVNRHVLSDWHPDYGEYLLVSGSNVERHKLR